MARRRLDDPSIGEGEAEYVLANQCRPVRHGKDRCGDPRAGSITRPDDHSRHNLGNGHGPGGGCNTVRRGQADPATDISHQQELYLRNLPVEYWNGGSCRIPVGCLSTEPIATGRHVVEAEVALGV
jgi:hypothetical protein